MRERKAGGLGINAVKRNMNMAQDMYKMPGMTETANLIPVRLFGFVRHQGCS